MKKIIPICLLFLNILLSYSQETTNSQDNLNLIELGRKLENPYSVVNMQKAYQKVRASVTNFPKLEVVTNHTYVRFLPKNEAELDLLYNHESENFILFDHPLDYEIKKEGNFYHDPAIPKDKPSWLYTVITFDYQIPADIKHIEFEEIEDLYLLPEEDENNSSSKNAIIKANEVYYTLLENKALEITDNLDANEENELQQKGSGKYHPSGSIKISNDLGQLESVPNVTVRTRRWFKTSFGITDSEGNFSVHKRYRKKVNFGVIYKNANANILAGPLDYNFALYGGAFLNGPKEYTWDRVSYRYQSSFEWGGIMKAVYDYHYKWASELNIPPPPKSLRIAAFTIKGGFAPMWNTSGEVHIPCVSFHIPIGKLLSDIYLDEERSSYHELYATAIHELSHTVHWEHAKNWSSLFDETCESIKQGSVFIQKNRMSAEAWADGVQHIVEKSKFGTLVNSRYLNDCYGINNKINEAYPRVIVRDLMDNKTQSYCEIVDNVSGFSLREIFDALVYNASASNNWLALWRDNLIAKRPKQREHLKQYFAQWLREKYIPCNDPSITISKNYNNRPTSRKKISIEHSNQITLSSGFAFEATNSNQFFHAKVECYKILGSASGSISEDIPIVTRSLDTEIINPSMDVISEEYNDNTKTETTYKESNEISFQPNPVTNQLTLESKNTKISWVLTDRYQTDFKLKGVLEKGDKKTIDVSVLSSGIYFLKIEYKNGENKTYKIVKT